jgi:hypothetical protein
MTTNQQNAQRLKQIKQALDDFLLDRVSLSTMLGKVAFLGNALEDTPEKWMTTFLGLWNAMQDIDAAIGPSLAHMSKFSEDKLHAKKLAQDLREHIQQIM